MYKVTNKSKTTQILYDKGGKRVELRPRESALMKNPPKESYIFKVEEAEKPKSRRSKLKGGN